MPPRVLYPPTYVPPPTYVAPPTYIVPNQPQVMPAPPPIAQVRPNAPPPAEPVTANLPAVRTATAELKPNRALAVPAISYALMLDAYQAVQAQQQQILDGIIDSLGPDMLADPGVQAALDNIQIAIDNGDPITDADLAAVNNAVIDALNNGVPITGGGTEASVNQALGSLQTLSAIQQILSFWPADGVVIPFPVGPVDVIFDPLLPSDAIFVTPGGALVDGTGGVGDWALGEGTMVDAAGLPPGEGEPVPPSTTDPSGRVTSGLLIMNPARNGVGIEYVVNKQNYSTPAGYDQIFQGTGKSTVEFNRGPGFGDARYSLDDGTYYFASTSRGWELYARPFSATIENAQNSNTFEYVVDDKNVFVCQI